MRLITPILVSVAFVMPVCGQNVLDADLYAKPGALPGGVVPVAPQQDFRSRNLLITNNVLGGRGFRGTVGYTSESDFRDALGSDDLFAFRAGAGWSNVNLVNFGDTYNRLRFGQNIGLWEFNRAGTGVSVGNVVEGDVGITPTMRLAGLDQIERMSIESALSSQLIRQADPVGLGQYVDGSQEVKTLGASPLLGLHEIDPDQDYRAIGLTRFDIARLREDAANGVLRTDPGARFQLQLLDRLQAAQAPVTALETRSESNATNPRINDLSTTGYQEILERIAARYAQSEGDETTAATDDLTDPNSIEALEGEMDDLTRELLGVDENGLPIDPNAAPPADADADSEEDQPSLALARVLRHGERIASLSTDDPGRLNEILRDAQDHLQKGEYFKAETDFNRALRFQPGNPLATIGLVHARIGAGLYLPAGLALRSLFTFQPEMIDARYVDTLVPNRPRLNEAIIGTRRLLNSPRNGDNFGLLLAYLGRLVDDQSLVEEGLAAMAAVDENDPMLELLRSIWLAPADAATGDDR